MPTRELNCRIPASLQYLTALRHLVHAFCADLLGAEKYEEQVYQLQLAVSELTTNIILHAYRDQEPGLIEMHATGRDAQVTLEFWDLGAPYPAEPTPPPESEALAEGGYGTFIIRKCVDTVTYERTKKRNHWRLVKQFGERGGH